jgi:hypothetical protein
MITIGILNYKGECQTWVGKNSHFYGLRKNMTYEEERSNYGFYQKGRKI